MKWLWIALGIGVILTLGAGVAVVTGLDEIVNKMAEAIKSFEGWSPGSRSYRNNNPGNLKFAGQAGAVGEDEEGHAIFASYAEGWSALQRQIRAAFTGISHVYGLTDTLYSFFAKYAEGNSTEYAEYVAAQLGVSPDDNLASILAGTSGAEGDYNV